MQHFNRERVPERVVHAKGSGAHGFFEVTEDVTQFTQGGASSAQVGKRTPVFARFSTVAGELGFPDTVRDPRGFAIKFYTEEGNYDLVGNNTPVFFVRDAIEVPGLHPLAEAPARHRHCARNDMQWDFWTLSPESAHQVTILMSDRGTPRTWRTHERLRQPHVLVDQRRRRPLLGQVPLQDRPGHRELHRRRGQGDDRRGPRLPPPRPVQRDRRRRRAGVAAGDADHAVRRGAGLPLQPVRPDQGLAARRLPADPGRPPGARPQPGELLRRGRAGRLLAREPRARASASAPTRC